MIVDEKASLTLALARAGLIQFGHFVQPDGAVWPVAINLRLLPSYPALLRDVAAALEPLLTGIEADRILTTTDAIPVGVALSLRTDRPLVYPYGEVRDYTAAFAIEGAYDVGHPTLLLSDSLVDAPQAEAITALARRVGLEVHTVLAVVDLGLGAHAALQAAGYTLRTVLTLRDMLPVLDANGLLPPAMHRAVSDWLEGGESDGGEGN
jgi:uridine monophosphate synthetase